MKSKRLKFSAKYVATFPNAVTLVGFIITVFGSLRLNELSGILLVAFGRSFDMLDGFIARKFHQATLFGAALDAFLDKIAGLMILLASWELGTAPKLAVLLIFLQNLANSFISVVSISRAHGLAITPSKAGKHAIFSQILALLIYALAYLLKAHYTLPSELLWILATIFTVIGAGLLGIKATVGYFHDFRALGNSAPKHP